jgi:hypothetical protein
MSGLEIVDRLYNQCCGVQGTPHYPLLLSLFSLSLTPYTHFLSQWLFRGWLDEKEELVSIATTVHYSAEIITTGLKGTLSPRHVARPFSPDTMTLFWPVGRLSISFDLSIHSIPSVVKRLNVHQLPWQPLWRC